MKEDLLSIHFRMKDRSHDTKMRQIEGLTTETAMMSKTCEGHFEFVCRKNGLRSILLDSHPLSGATSLFVSETRNKRQ